MTPEVALKHQACTSSIYIHSQRLPAPSPANPSQITGHESNAAFFFLFFFHDFNYPRATNTTSSTVLEISLLSSFLWIFCCWMKCYWFLWWCARIWYIYSFSSFLLHIFIIICLCLFLAYIYCLYCDVFWTGVLCSLPMWTWIIVDVWMIRVTGVIQARLFLLLLFSNVQTDHFVLYVLFHWTTNGQQSTGTKDYLLKKEPQQSL